MHPSTGKTSHSARTIDLDDNTLSVLARWREDHLQRFGDHDPERGLVVRDDGELVNPQTPLPRVRPCCREDRAAQADAPTYQHVLPGMQAHAAATFASLLETSILDASTGSEPVEEPVERDRTAPKDGPIQ